MAITFKIGYKGTAFFDICKFFCKKTIREEGIRELEIRELWIRDRELGIFDCFGCNIKHLYVLSFCLEIVIYSLQNEDFLHFFCQFVV